MSVATNDTETAECQHCGGPRNPDASVGGSFCSHECYYNAKGTKALNQIKQDHLFCSTCFRQVKTVEEPPDGWVDDAVDPVQVALDAGASITNNDGDLVLDATEAATHRRTVGECVIGYQFPTEHTEFAEDAIGTEDHEPWDSPVKKSIGVYGCECGAIDLHERDTTLASVEGGTVLINLVRCLATLHAKGAIKQPPDTDMLFDGLRETHDFEYAVGMCLYA